MQTINESTTFEQYCLNEGVLDPFKKWIGRVSDAIATKKTENGADKYYRWLENAAAVVSEALPALKKGRSQGWVPEDAVKLASQIADEFPKMRGKSTEKMIVRPPFVRSVINILFIRLNRSGALKKIQGMTQKNKELAALVRFLATYNARLNDFQKTLG